MRRSFFLFLGVFMIFGLFFSCKGKSTKAKSSEQSEIDYIKYPTLPMERRQALLSFCDAIDIIYYNLPISMNQDDRISIQRNIHFSMDVEAKVNPSCKAMAHIIYLSKGEVMEEADIYFSDKCKYFVFWEDQKPAYANMMSKLGNDFFSNVLMQVQGKKFPGLK